MEAVRVLIENGANLEAVDEVYVYTRMQPHMRAHKPSYKHTCTHWLPNAQSRLV